jgi:CRP/FNR family transcriptional regulator, cyclic AMP receptor protein
MPDRDPVDFLTTVPLLQGLTEADLAELARVMRRRTLAEGEVLWREGHKAKGMVLIVDGKVSVTKRLPGDGAVEVADLGPGEALGEIPLVDGGEHSSTARVTQSTTVLSLNRLDFAALVSRRDPSAFALKRRVAAVVAERLRRQLGVLAASLGERVPGDQEPDVPQPCPELEFTGPPNSAYVRRMATFHDFDSLALWGFLTAGRYARCPRGHPLIAEDAPPAACYLTINGAVEKVLIRGDRRIRVELAGPGQAFGYESLIDGGPSPVTAITRERALLLVLSVESFQRLFHGDTDVSHVFLDVINRNLAASLRMALRPQARLAVSA